MTAEWDGLPDTVRTFVTALHAVEVDRVLATVTADAAVTDEGRTHVGRDEIGAWVTASVSEYTYAAEFTGASTTDATIDVGQRLEGDFPGGVADLHYRFTMDGALISRLVIEP